jgi:hypothetical protein
MCSSSLHNFELLDLKLYCMSVTGERLFVTVPTLWVYCSTWCQLFPSAVHCEPMEINDPYLTSRVEGTRLGQVAVFQCPIGFRLNGTSNLTCQASGKSSTACQISMLFESFISFCLKSKRFFFVDSCKVKGRCKQIKWASWNLQEHANEDFLLLSVFYIGLFQPVVHEPFWKCWKVSRGLLITSALLAF